MKNYFSAFLIAALAFSLQINAQTNKEPFLTKNFPASIKNVKVETSGGSITVDGAGEGQTRVEMYVQANGNNNNMSKEEIQSRLEKDYAIEIITNNQQVSAIAQRKNKNFNWRDQLSISFKVFVPKNVSTDLNTSGGSISISNVSGEQDFKTSGGSLNVANVKGKINGRTSGGSIQVSDSDSEIDLSTSGGSIAAKDCSGNIRLNTSGGSLDFKRLKGNLQAKTSGGSVHGKDIEGDVDAHTSGGNISFDNMSGSLKASTSGGNINVEMTKLDKFLTLNNSGGNVQLTVPKNQGLDLNLRGNRVKSTTFTNFSGSMEDDEVKGQMNGGGAQITVKGSGNVQLAFR
jgi:DUF4097 and DUF4098 domain-containing protein YvlB